MKNRRRRGAALVAALTLLVVVLMTVGATLQQLRVQQQAARTAHRKLQAEWLAQSALERAAMRLHADRKYAGETWEPATTDNGDDHGSVLIEVERLANPPAVDLQVTADFPKHPTQRARVVASRRLTLPAPQE